MATKQDVELLDTILLSQNGNYGFVTRDWCYENDECDICSSQNKHERCVVDGLTSLDAWAFMCRDHFISMGVGLGTGKGQVLLITKD